MTLWQRISQWWQTASGATTRISPNELQALIVAKTPLYLLDVRSSLEYKHDGHIAGAHLIPLGELPSKFGQLPRDRMVVCICRSGARSSAALNQLAQAGFTDIRNLSGGMMAWNGANLPTTRK
ncbi:MAG: rhodanese-like domain-containing protein [Chloroflexia bacterium]|nr:rhodanese-like domain-containing protein [Chloroflexia bacterium]